LGEPNSIGDISEHGDETDSNEVGDMPLAFQPSHCYSMGAAIPTEMPESTKYTKFPHEELNLCQAESEVSVEFLRRGVNTKENKVFGLQLHPTSCEGYPQKGKAPREVKLTKKCMTIYPSMYMEGEHLNIWTFLTHVQVIVKHQTFFHLT
jgi:hypothetical protein